MAWIKRNLLFVVGLAVAAILFLGSSFYLYQSWDQSQTALAELNAKNQALDAIVNTDPFPNPENLKQVKEEQQRVEDFKKSAASHFTELVKPEGLDNAAFKTLLESRLAGLVREAEHTGVRLPEKYDFTFGEQRKVLQIPEKALAPLALHLDDVTDICHILFSARVHSIVSIKRTTVGTNDSNSSSDFLLSKKVTTNTVAAAALFPYEIAFQGFSSELSAVLSGLRDAQKAFDIKTVNVERGTTSETTPTALNPAMTQGMPPSMASRYGLGPYSRMQQPVAAPAVTRPNEPVLEPKLLRFTIGLDVIKLLPTVASPAAKTASTAQNARQ